jgi:hypothetical protein
MRDLARAIVIAAALLGGSLVIRAMYGPDRWELVQTAGGAVYRLDRIGGSVSFCTPLLCRPLPTLTPDNSKKIPLPQHAPQAPTPGSPGGAPPAATGGTGT